MLRYLLIAVCLTAAGAAEAQSYYACGTPEPKLNFCRREIERVNVKMRRLSREYERTGKGYGTSFGNCAIDCVEVHPSLKDKLK